jgi:hypothetical protein
VSFLFPEAWSVSQHVAGSSVISLDPFYSETGRKSCLPATFCPQHGLLIGGKMHTTQSIGIGLSHVRRHFRRWPKEIHEPLEPRSANDARTPLESESFAGSPVHQVPAFWGYTRPAHRCGKTSALEYRIL